jgi:hypothetical protein
VEYQQPADYLCLPLLQLQTVCHMGREYEPQVYIHVDERL